MLYKPDAFEPLTDRPWDESRVRDAIAEIAHRAEPPTDELEVA